MHARPDNLNVVISGAWNPAILTPDGIRKRLFRLPDGTPLQLEVAIDRPGSFRVIHDDVIVAPSLGQLEIAAQSNDLASLKKASEIGQMALRNLPETPVAAGINFGFTLDPLSDDLLDLLKMPIDDAFSDDGFTIEGRLIRHSLKQSPGVVNVEIGQTSESRGTVLMNFHYASSSPNELGKWLSDVSKFWGISQRLLVTMKIPAKEEPQE